MKVTITRNEGLNNWVVNTYKGSMVADQVFVTGEWSTQVKGKFIKWIVDNHQHVESIMGVSAHPALEKIDEHHSAEVLNSEIAGYPIIFTKDGVFTSTSGGKEGMGNSIQEAMARNGITRKDLEEKVVPSVTQVMDKSKQEVHAVIQRQTQSLEEYYFEKYGKPKSDIEAVNLLVTCYKELMGTPHAETREGIAEYYRIINNRALPAFHWMVEAFHVVSKKDSSKRTFSYVVGMLRSWLKYGFGHIPSSEEEDVMQFTEEVIGRELSHEAVQVIKNLLGTYGAIKLSYMLHQLKEVDYSYFMVLSLKDLLDKKFGASAEDKANKA